jgi:tetratricopeptide (TPR) repeat protein
MLQKAFEAFENKNYSAAGQLWLEHIDLSSGEVDLEKILSACKKAEQDGINNEWLYATISLVYLDAEDIFMDKKNTLMEAITYAKKAIALQPLMHQALRFAGSACYWLGDYVNAKKYFEQSIKIFPDVILLQRIIYCATETGQPIGTINLTIDFENTNAAYFYEQGVGANGLSKSNISEINNEEAATLARSCYERCFGLYTAQLNPPVANAEQEISPDKHQHNLAMCCNNLAVIYNDLKKHNEALSVLNVGKQFSNFLALWQNIKHTYYCLNNVEAEALTAIHIIENFETEDELWYHCMCRICYYNMMNSDFEDALDTANEAIEEYQNLSPESQGNPTITNCYAELYNNKITAEKALGILVEADIDDTIIDAALLESPDNIALIITRGVLLMQQGDFDKSLNCFNQAVQFATENNEENKLRDALMKRGFLKLYYLNKATDALLDFDKIEKMGKADFYIYYYQMNCHYIKKMHPQSMMAYKKASDCITEMVENDAVSMAQLYMMQGDTLFDLNKLNDAVIAYEKSLQYQFIDGVENNMKLAKSALNMQQNE